MRIVNGLGEKLEKSMLCAEKSYQEVPCQDQSYDEGTIAGIHPSQAELFLNVDFVFGSESRCLSMRHMSLTM